jgi:hypothetical protein
MKISATDFVKFEIAVNALSSLCFVFLEAGHQVEEVRRLKDVLVRQVNFKNLTPFEKKVWRESLIKMQQGTDESFYYGDEGAIDYCIGERARLKGLTADDNPYPKEAFGYERWLDGWTEQDKRTNEDEAYSNCNEMTEWNDDVRAQLADLDNDEEDVGPLWGETLIATVSEMNWSCHCGAVNTIRIDEYGNGTNEQSFVAGGYGYHTWCAACRTEFVIQIPIHKYASVIDIARSKSILRYFEDRDVRKESIETSSVLSSIQHCMRKARDALYNDGELYKEDEELDDILAYLTNNENN